MTAMKPGGLHKGYLNLPKKSKEKAAEIQKRVEARKRMNREREKNPVTLNWTTKT